MKIKTKLYTFFLIIFLTILMFKFFKFKQYKMHVFELNNEKNLYKIELYLNSYYGTRKEFPEIAKITNYIDNNNISLLNEYGYEIVINKDHDEVTLYSHGFNKNNNLENILSLTELNDFTFFDYLIDNKINVVLFSFKNFISCNITLIEALNIYDNNDSTLDLDFFLKVKEEIQKIETYYNSDKENDSIDKVAFFKYKEGEVVCMCDSGIKKSKIKSLENKLKIMFNGLENELDIKLATFSINLILNDSEIDVPSEKIIFSSNK